MEHPLLFLTKFFELIGLGEFAHHYPHVVYSWFIILFLILVAKLATRGLKMIPAGGQNLFEVMIKGIEDFQISIMGEQGRPFFPLIATLGLYILVMNWIGLIPGMLSPTANINTPLSCALVVVIVTHAVGIKEHGFKYIRHFLGPVWWLAPLMFIIEVIGHMARVMSLTFRLFGNIRGEDLVIAILVALGGFFLAPLPMYVLAIFTSFVQAFIFSLLSMMYISGALEEAHH
jgi:F-type H+-transporting ATPase subunit a